MGYTNAYIHTRLNQQCICPDWTNNINWVVTKNAILIVEYAKVRVDGGEDLIQSTIKAVNLRLRPIIMTSMAFILGVMPLVLASGAGAVARRTIGVTVLGEMIAASSIAIFIVPVLFVVIVKIAYGKTKLELLVTNKEKVYGKNEDLRF